MEPDMAPSSFMISKGFWRDTRYLGIPPGNFRQHSHISRKILLFPLKILKFDIATLVALLCNSLI